MRLTKFKLVNTDGLKGLHYKGDFIPFDKIDDTLAEELLSKTYVLERVSEPTLTKQPAALPEAAKPAVLPEATELAAEATAPTPRRRSNG